MWQNGTVVELVGLSELLGVQGYSEHRVSTLQKFGGYFNLYAWLSQLHLFTGLMNRIVQNE